LLGDRVALHAVRGQIGWGLQDGLRDIPASPVNGEGHFIPSVPTDAGMAWFCGSTYGRGDTDTSVRKEDTLANVERLHALLPAVAGQIDFRNVRAWAGVRCTSFDRRPLVGEISPGVWVTTAMGSRGLTFCTVCAELLAARLHAEPLPVPQKLAAALDVRRQWTKPHDDNFSIDRNNCRD
jgi:tRNA 5-methylaminomethyl-2-thiouridine biosynthesis bifunctional protein